MPRIEPMMKHFTGACMHPLTLVDHPIFLTATTRFKEYHSGICVISHNIDIALQPSNKQCSILRSQKVCNPLFSLFSPGSLSQGDTSICAEQLTTTCWVYWKGGRVRWQRDYLDTDLLIWLILSHNHYDKFSWHDSSWIWVWAPYKTISKQK